MSLHCTSDKVTVDSLLHLPVLLTWALWASAKLSLSIFISFTSVGRGRPNVWQASRIVTWSSAATVTALLMPLSVRLFTSALSERIKTRGNNPCPRLFRLQLFKTSRMWLDTGHQNHREQRLDYTKVCDYNYIIIWNRFMWLSMTIVFKYSKNQVNGSLLREKLTFYDVRDLRSKLIIIFIRLPDSRTETRHVVLSGTSRVHSDGAGHRGGIDVTRMTIQLRVSAVEDDLIHCRTPSSHRTRHNVSGT